MRSKISRVLVIYVLLFSGTITLSLTAVQLYLNYRYDLSLIEQRLHQIEISNLDNLRENLWTLDKRSLQLQLDGLARQPDMQYLAIFDQNGNELASAGRFNDRNAISRSYPLTYSYRGSEQSIGKLRVSATLDNVYQRLIDTFLVILATQAIKTFFVSIFILLLFRQLVTRHLVKLAKTAESIDPQKPETAFFALDRKENRFTRNDELSSLTEAFNSMRRRVLSAYSTLRRRETMLIESQRTTQLGSWEWDRHGGRVHWSEGMRLLMGWGDGRGPDHDLSRYIEEVHPDDRARVERALEQLQQRGTPIGLEHRRIDEHGNERRIELHVHEYQDEFRDRSVLIGTVRDITQTWKQQTELRTLSNCDPLTGLPNRKALHHRLQRLIDATAAGGFPAHGVGGFSLALIDLDGFKEINDALGHGVGDQLLMQLRPRFEQAMSEHDFVARLGGDEFAVVLGKAVDRSSGVDRVHGLREVISAPFNLENIRVQISASVGIALYPEHGTDSSTLLRHADVAMYHAKKSGSGLAHYDPEIDPHSTRRLELMGDVRRALDQTEFELYYQPKVAATGRRQAVGLEALIRWHHPDHGLVSPNEFIPFCEFSDLIHPLSAWVVGQAIRDARHLDGYGHELQVSVNLSSRNLLDRALPDTLASLLAQHRFPAARLQLEITESALMDDPRHARKTLDALRELGVGLAIDDYGTGYSSLSYLKHLQVNELKIDRSFVRDMQTDPNDAIIVKSTIELAHNLGMRVTAEGVEHEETLRSLADSGCDLVQGFLICRPLPRDALLSDFLDAAHDNPAVGGTKGT